MRMDAGSGAAMSTPTAMVPTTGMSVQVYQTNENSRTGLHIAYYVASFHKDLSSTTSVVIEPVAIQTTSKQLPSLLTYAEALFLRTTLSVGLA